MWHVQPPARASSPAGAADSRKGSAAVTPLQIGTLREFSLHAALKTWCAVPGDRFEVLVDGYIVDVVRDDLLIEIQTRRLGALRAKIAALQEQHALRLVLPIARELWVVRVAEDGQTRLSRRKSPRHGRIEDIFSELTGVPSLLEHPHVSLQVVLTQEEQLLYQGEPIVGRRSWRRRGWAILDRQLLAVVGERTFHTAHDLARLLPADLPAPFTTRDIAECGDLPLHLAQQMAFCLHRMGVLERSGKRGNAWLYVAKAEVAR